MGSCLKKPPVDIEVNTASSCPCCDNDTTNCTSNCCVIFAKRTPSPSSVHNHKVKNGNITADVTMHNK